MIGAISRVVGVGLVAALLAPVALAAEAGRPDFSGFWVLSRDYQKPDPELVKRVPAGTVFMDDTGGAEFGPMEFGGLKPTPAALEAAKAWKAEQDMALDKVCRVPSIVYALQGPFPIEIDQASELLVMRLEYYDMARVIFLDGRAERGPNAPHTKTGFSRGHWDGDILEVVTTHLKGGTITNNGLEHGEAMKVIERFRLTDGGKVLQASQEYEDPETLENRGVRYISWRKTEGDHVHAYDCDPSFGENYKD